MRGIYLQYLCQAILEILLANKAIKVLVEALKGLLYRKLLVCDPFLNPLDRRLLPVEIVLNTFAREIFLSQYIQELLVRDQPSVVFVH